MSEQERDVVFLDLFNPNQPRSGKELADFRLDICKGCEYFSKKQTCKKCGCIMKAKTTLKNAKCPIGKW
jgi:hypothetical protein